MSSVEYSKHQSGHQGCGIEALHMCHLRIIFFNRISKTLHMSFTYIIKSNGPKMDPCGTP